MTFPANHLPPSNGNENAQHELFMREALRLAKEAALQQEVPVGAVLVKNNEIIARAHNGAITLEDPTAHAEILCLRAAAKTINNYRLVNTTLYVTLEPCMMCAGALIHARITHLVFGAHDVRAGAIETHAHLLKETFHNHRVNYLGGILAEESRTVLRDFFLARRKK